MNTAQKKVESFFQSIPKKPFKPYKRIQEPFPKKGCIQVKESSFKQNFLYVSWPTVSACYKDVIGLESLALILGQGRSSRLVKSLKLEDCLVQSIQGFFILSSR